jgi:hypothetical protein
VRRGREIAFIPTASPATRRRLLSNSGNGAKQHEGVGMHLHEDTPFSRPHHPVWRKRPVGE